MSFEYFLYALKYPPRRFYIYKTTSYTKTEISAFIVNNKGRPPLILCALISVFSTKDYPPFRALLSAFSNALIFAVLFHILLSAIFLYYFRLFWCTACTASRLFVSLLSVFRELIQPCTCSLHLMYPHCKLYTITYVRGTTLPILSATETS